MHTEDLKDLPPVTTIAFAKLDLSPQTETLSRVESLVFDQFMESIRNKGTLNGACAFSVDYKTKRISFLKHGGLLRSDEWYEKQGFTLITHLPSRKQE